MATQDILVWDGSAWVSIQGPEGQPGQAASISVDSTSTGDPGTPANVVNVGTPQNAQLQFTIPQGLQGPAATLQRGTVGTQTLPPGSNANVIISNSGTTAAAVFDFSFSIPRGEKGEAGTGVTITGSISYVGPPVSPEADGAQDGDMIIDSNGDGWVFAGSGWTNVGAIRGPEGPKGDQATVAVGSVTTNDVPVDGNGDSQNASVTVSDGTPADPHSSTMNFVFNVPTGATGAKGDAGENFEVYKQASQPVAKNVGAMWIETT